MACLFDMDGLLVDSETIYTKTTNLILDRYGKDPLPISVKAQMMGMLYKASEEIF